MISVIARNRRLEPRSPIACWDINLTEADFCLILLILATGTASVATAADYIVPSGVAVLTEKQLLTRIVGNTLVGGNVWVHYYEPAANNSKEGRLKGRHRAYDLSGETWEIYSGSWKIREVLFCREFDMASMAVYNGCYTIALDGNTVIQYTIHGKVHTDISGHVFLASGNPYNL